MGRVVGEAICTSMWDELADRPIVRVDKADPFIMISTEMLDAPEVEVDGDIVKFGDINPVTYRITERYELHVVAERIA